MYIFAATTAAAADTIFRWHDFFFLVAFLFSFYQFDLNDQMDFVRAKYLY